MVQAFLLNKIDCYDWVTEQVDILTNSSSTIVGIEAGTELNNNHSSSQPCQVPVEVDLKNVFVIIKSNIKKVSTNFQTSL